MKTIVDNLCQEHTLNAEEYRSLLLCEDAEVLGYLQEKARQTTIARFGHAVFIPFFCKTQERFIQVFYIRTYNDEKEKEEEFGHMVEWGSLFHVL